MDFFSSQFSKGLQRYWRRRSYQRLDGSGKKNPKTVRLGGNTRRSWKIRAIPKLRIKIYSPIKLLTRLRDAYMNAMLKLVGNTGSLQSGNAFGGKRIPRARTVKESSSDFEIRMVLEICKSIVASRDLAVV
ncbi:uncharacterized protein LOC143854856 [Tasmannia lanceolata]|uniref:uncharacterized protein LOC143854856 n=1 Tax=Tasmannia lanceolata TaxID=3420 RepID=UPI004063B907